MTVRRTLVEMVLKAAFFSNDSKRRNVTFNNFCSLLGKERGGINFQTSFCLQRICFQEFTSVEKCFRQKWRRTTFTLPSHKTALQIQPHSMTHLPCPTFQQAIPRIGAAFRSHHIQWCVSFIFYSKVLPCLYTFSGDGFQREVMEESREPISLS